MRVILVSHAVDNPNAGASRVYHQLAEGLGERGHDVTLLHLNELIPTWTGPRFVLRLRLPFVLSQRVARRLNQHDVIMASNGMLYPLFRHLQRTKSRSLLVNHIHGLTFFDNQAVLAEMSRGHGSITLLDRILFRRSAPSWDRLGCLFSDVTVVQNGRDLDYLSERRVSPLAFVPLSVHPQIRQASDSAPDQACRDPHRLLWFGAWSCRKGCHYLSRAFELILAECPGARLCVAGTDAPRRVVMAEFSPSISSRVDFVPRINIPEHIALLARTSILLFPSLSEGFGYALLEAMSMGVAVVTTQTGMGGDYLINERSAMVVPFGSSTHLARATIRLIRDTALRSTIARNGQSLSRQFTRDRFVRDYEGIFERFLEQRYAFAAEKRLDVETTQ